jgi:uncharacterized membrane protein YdjX (TVP38/TMEM64 family)
MKFGGRFRILALAALIASGAVCFFLLKAQQDPEAFKEWVKELGPWGLVLLAAAYTPTAVFMGPAAALTVSAGVLFPRWPAVLAVSLGSTVAAAVAFLIGRTLARRWVEERLARNPRFRALDEAVAEEGFKIVLLTRLSPVFPYVLLNYAFSLTKVSFRSYLVASWIGMLPGTVMYVSLGSAAKGFVTLLLDLFRTGKVEDPVQTLFLFLGVAATVLVTVVVTRMARRVLARTAPTLEAEKSTPRSPDDA